MSRTNHQITGARESINLVVDNDTREFLLSPLRDIDISELDLWLQNVYIRQASKEDAADIEQIKATAETLSALYGSGAEMLECADGYARRFWQSACRNHPGLSYEECRNIMREELNQQYFQYKFELLNYVSSAVVPRTKTSVPQNKGTIYSALAEMYKWTFQQIAEMTPLQQLIALSKGKAGTDQAYFETEEQFLKWLAEKNNA